jgi:acyl carrier protein
METTEARIEASNSRMNDLDTQRAINIIASYSMVHLLRGVSRDTLLSELGYDSLQFVALCVELEDTFRVDLTDAEPRSVGALIDSIARAREARP